VTRKANKDPSAAQGEETRVSTGPTEPREGRRFSLVRAAYDVIASEGFEGLRTRTVADRAGVNIATLHYYFPTKEALIGALAEYLVSLFMSVHGPAGEASGVPTIDRLRREFSDARFYRLERPDMFSVIQELLLRAQRDPSIRSIMAPLMYHWRSDFERIIEDGIREGVFRSDIVPLVGAALITSTIVGTASLNVAPEVLDGIFRAIEHWLVIPQQTSRKGNGDV
jgi:TetR/AcrR family transcriptional regulator, regulator of cefoperazone and chloramphenicol sensitivity